MTAIIEFITKFKTNLIIGALLLVGTILGVLAIYEKGRSDERTKQQLEIAKLRDSYKSREKAWIAEINQGNQKYEDTINGIGVKLADVLIWMQQRPARMPESSRPACKGATGAELSGPDADFLARESARADILQAALDRCQTYNDTVRDYIKSLK